MSTATTNLSAEAAANLPRHVTVILDGNVRRGVNPRLPPDVTGRNFVP
jgi:undecaprenyl pyrophosphate synthase